MTSLRTFASSQSCLCSSTPLVSRLPLQSTQILNEIVLRRGMWVARVSNELLTSGRRSAALHGYAQKLLQSSLKQRYLRLLRRTCSSLIFTFVYHLAASPEVFREIKFPHKFQLCQSPLNAPQFGLVVSTRYV